MNKKLASTIAVIVFFGIMASLAILFYSRSKDLGITSSPTPMATLTPTPVAQSGFIEGTLSYPSETIPQDMQVCAETLQNQKIKCSSEQIKMDSAQGYGIGYRLEVQPGSYYVYAMRPANPEQKAYYSEFVTCGLSVNCQSHAPIEVKVNPGETTSDINPHDWYAPIPSPTTSL